jgi:hypothetical protein
MLSMVLEKSIKIVYYVYLDPKSNWQDIISGQLTQLLGYGILNSADLYIHITDCYNLKNDVTEIILHIVPVAILSFNYDNQYEYPAIKLIYDLAKRDPHNNFIYFHTKGMSHGIQARLPKEIILLTKTFENWESNIQLLNKKGINKIGLFPAIWLEKFAKPGEKGGWVFYNFWYASGNYLSQCELPKPNANRFYYEGWLGRYKGQEPYITNDCISLNKIQYVTKNYYTGSEADYYLNLLESNPSIFEERYDLFNNIFIRHCYLQLKKFIRLYMKK